MSELISARMRRRMREQGSSPLLTYYDLDSGERTELSGISFGNWVDKTSNLLVDEMLVDTGDEIELAVAQEHPGHWVTLVWALACWQVGATVTIGQPSLARIVVAGPDWAEHVGVQELVACSLHPLGLPFRPALPSGVTDYTLEVRGQSDFHAAVPQSGLSPAWHDGVRQLTQADLVGGPAAGSAQRTLVHPSDPWTSVRTAIIEPVLTGGSAVVVTGAAADDELARIRATERCTA